MPKPSAASAMPKALERRLKYAGPALFSYGFRPFFLGGALWSALAILCWLPQYMGALSLRNAYSPLDWHVHEMLFGYVAAVIAGFLLTAIPNWTGRLPICGVPLAGLAGLWLLGRLAMLGSGLIGIVPAAVIDVAFLVTLAAAAGREIVAGRNWRNLRVLAVLGLLIAGNVVFHAEVATLGRADYGIRIGIGSVILLISIVGGRIVPSFTRNWLVRQGGEGRLPIPFTQFDALVIAATLFALALWIAWPNWMITGVALILAALAQVIRLTRWAGERTAADRLVLVLHIAYAFVPAGFALGGAAILHPNIVSVSAGIHAWTAGAIGMMTLAVMTRASLGHTGNALIASRGTQTIYALVFLAALLRIAATYDGSMLLVELAGASWIAAFGGFVVIYGPLLAKEKPVWADRA